MVRLKGGDPMIFGRATEEIEGCRAAGVPIIVVPGVTAALGAAASLQTSLTERSVARRLQFITAHAKDGRLPEDIDWRSLADRHAASVVYMGVRTMPALVEKLLAHGLAPATPAVLVERASHVDERRIAGTIATMPALAAAAAPTGPCLLMIGLAFARAATATAAPDETSMARRPPRREKGATEAAPFVPKCSRRLSSARRPARPGR